MEIARMSMDSFKINLNQNLWGLLLSLLTLGASEYYELKILLVFGLILSIASSLSYGITLFFYTKNYYKKKSKKDDQ